MKRKIHILHLTEDHSFKAGGVPAVVDQLSNRIARNSEFDVSILCVRENAQKTLGVKISQCKPSFWANSWGWSPGLENVILKHLCEGNTNIIHIHGVWMAIQYLGVKVALRNQVSTILSTHGMLEPWHWNSKGKVQWMKKLMYWNLIAYPEFKKVSVIHALTKTEHDNLKSLFPVHHIKVIPNAMDLSLIDKMLSEVSKSTLNLPDRYIAFIGRLHPQKGIDVLIKAFAESNLSKEWKLLIAGPEGYPGYLEVLKKICTKHNLEGRVTFLGLVNGVDKWKLYRQAWAICLPSRSEGQSLVALEAMSSYTPILTTMTPETQHLTNAGCILFEAENHKELAWTIQRACLWDASERDKRGSMSRNYIQDHHNWDVLIEVWNELYQSITS